MLQFPNAKINLGLRIISKREDGFHEVETCMYPIPWSDALEIIPADKFSFETSGLSIEGDIESNLVYKAYLLVKDDFDIPPVKVHLHKVIPMGAGLGGGSADAAYMIKMLNAEFELGMSSEKMRELASQLGSDCAFFIDNIPAVCTGRGEIMEPIDFTLSGLTLVLIKPEVHVSTAQAYAGVVPKQPKTTLKNIILNPTNIKEDLINDFEESIFPKFPELQKIKDSLYNEGAVYAAMSGSGSTIYGLFEQSNVETVMWEDQGYLVKKIEL